MLGSDLALLAPIMGEREARQQAVVAVALFHAVVLLLKNTKSRAFGSTQWCLLRSFFGSELSA